MFVTDAILATLMCATRSQYSWDIVVDKIGGKVGKSKDLYTGTPISDELKLCTVYSVGGIQTNPVPSQKLKGKD